MLYSSGKFTKQQILEIRDQSLGSFDKPKVFRSYLSSQWSVLALETVFPSKQILEPWEISIVL